MRVDIEIDTFDSFLTFELFETKHMKKGITQKKIADNVNLQYNCSHIRLSVVSPETILLVLQIAADLTAIILFADWLYNKLKDKDKIKIRIDGTETEVEKEQIEKILKEKILGS